MALNAKQLMSTQEVVEYLQISYSTVRRLIYDGSLACHKIRGNLRFCPEDVNRFIESTRIGPTKNKL